MLSCNIYRPHNEPLWIVVFVSHRRILQGRITKPKGSKLYSARNVQKKVTTATLPFRAKRSRAIDRYGQLPDPATAPAGKVPVNAGNQRLDMRFPFPSQNDLDTYRANRDRYHNVCLNLVLLGSCGDERCQRSSKKHELPPKATRRVLAWHTRQNKLCPRGSECRLISCYYGHMWVWNKCPRRGRKSEGSGVVRCRVKLHLDDWLVNKWVEAESETRVGETKGLIDVDEGQNRIAEAAMEVEAGWTGW
ncbi:hypothetical protein M011DRAFT_466045 [Sporormia fimetaria CBS 119925]|uniref:Tandem CCCH zinc finger domain-containing protein n=1 Tax=Sporormia fimetaria CBS 119925 TaxID=1340428 RepID=A0A6A6VIG3_9PLEO|nr:hypothetical protein M011DRAFT_466045 [Sporormia fimetaria CBS 119925]